MKNLMLFPLITLFLSACAKPLAENQRNYIGTWKNDDSSIQLKISAEGYLKYSHQNMRFNTAISGPIHTFEGNHIQVGFGPFSSDFIISQAPYLNNDGTWSMRIDGRYLNRTQ